MYGSDIQRGLVLKTIKKVLEDLPPPWMILINIKLMHELNELNSSKKKKKLCKQDIVRKKQISECKHEKE